MIVDLAIRGKLRCRNLADVNKQEGVLQQSELLTQKAMNIGKIITRPERLFQLEPVVLNYFEEISSQ